MAEKQTLREGANHQRWCLQRVPFGQEKWPQGENAWHPLRGYCKARGASKINGEWRCKRHLPRDGKHD